MSYKDTFIEALSSQRLKTLASTTGTELNAIALALEAACNQLEGRFEGIQRQYTPELVENEFVNKLALMYGVDTSTQDWQGATLEQKRNIIKAHKPMDTGTKDYYESHVRGNTSLNISHFGICTQYSNNSLGDYVAGHIKTAITPFTLQNVKAVQNYLTNISLVGDFIDAPKSAILEESGLAYPSIDLVIPPGRTSDNVDEDLAMSENIIFENKQNVCGATFDFMDGFEYLRTLGYKVYIKDGETKVPLDWDTYMSSINFNRENINYVYS